MQKWSSNRYIDHDVQEPLPAYIREERVDAQLGYAKIVGPIIPPLMFYLLDVHRIALSLHVHILKLNC